MRIRNFEVEVWMAKYETDCRYNLAETCVESMSIDDLLAMTGKRDELLAEIAGVKLNYGAIEGSYGLRSQIADLYETMTPENVTVAHGGISANTLVLFSLIRPQDKVVCLLPTYQQHYSVPESIGAWVRPVYLRPENEYLPDLEELAQVVGDDTAMICISNPNNPTGAVMPEEMLRQIAGIAEGSDAYLLCDEVYRGLIHASDNFGVSVADIYHKGISTGSMSKTFSLAGLRLGWIVTSQEILGHVVRHRDYHVISVGYLNDRLAEIALGHREPLLARNLAVVRGNAALLGEWVANEPRVSYVCPKGGTTALLRYDADIDSAGFCRRLQREKDVMLLPGSAFDMEGHVRIGYCNNPEIIRSGLQLTSQFLAEIA